MITPDDPQLLASIRQHEGHRDKVYDCGTGRELTWIDPSMAVVDFKGRSTGWTGMLPEGAPTIGYGQNLLAWTERHSEACLRVSVEDAIEWLSTNKAAWIWGEDEGMTDNRRRALVEMTYQLGAASVNGFRNMWAAMAEGDYARAADEMLDSQWARQTPDRAEHCAQLMREG